MKRLIGYILAGIGAVGTIAGAYHVATGHSNQLLYGIKALYVGLGGIALLVLGLTTARD